MLIFEDFSICLADLSICWVGDSIRKTHSSQRTGHIRVGTQGGVQGDGGGP